MYIDRETLEAALAGLDLERSQIEARIAEVKRLLREASLGMASVAADGLTLVKHRGRPKGSMLSAEARARIGAAVKRRWAKLRRERRRVA